MDSIGSSVRRELTRLGPPGRIRDVVAVWPDAVGQDIARNAWPARIGRDGTLHVAVSSSAWAFELAQLAPTIADRLAALLEEPPAALRFAPGPLPEAPPEPAQAPSRAPAAPSEPELRQAAALAAAIAAPGLREAVARAAAAGLQWAASGRCF
jgi:hypothetical protein